MPHAYTEDQLVEQPAIGLFAELEQDPHDRTYDRACFGFRPRDSMENVAPEEPLQRFVLRCDGCHNGEVQIQVGWGEGEVRGALVCLRCRRREALPSRLLRCDT